jgi:hypothetical protein
MNDPLPEPEHIAGAYQPSCFSRVLASLSLGNIPVKASLLTSAEQIHFTHIITTTIR